MNWPRPLVIFLLLNTAGTLADHPTQTWQRSWTLVGFDCPSCTRAERASIAAYQGNRIIFGPRSFTNPFYENCTEGVDYSAIKQQPATIAENFFGAGRLPTMVEESPWVGVVRCKEAFEPPNTIARVVIDGDRLFLLHESGAVLWLR